MNILDIAIAKKLAGGGGGSGTDNYNDLSNLPKINDTTLSGNKTSANLGLQSEINSDSKLASDLVDDTNQDNKFVTSSEKSTWNGKQNAIDADHKINADYVDDSTSTNKFVTATDKETWNAKQNAIDSSHKLSSDLVDDTNHTNKFVTSTEKQTWNGKQNAIDSDHKLSSSLVSFTTAEAAALASGIDSTKVGQISTNQTNILSVYDEGFAQKNVLHFESLKRTNVNYGRSIITNGVRFTINDDNTITVNRETASNEEAYVELCISGYDTFFADQYCDGEHYLSGCPSGGSDSTYKLYAAKSTYAKYDAGDGVLLTSTPITEISIVILVYNGYNAQNLVFKPMIRHVSTNPTYQPYALPNTAITPELIELCDSGAKNKLQNKATSKTENNVTFTVNSDGEVTVSTTAQGASANTSVSLTGTYIPNTFVGNILSGLPSGSTSDKCLLIAYSNDGSSETKAYYLNAVSAPIHEIQNYPYFQLFVWFKSGEIQTTPLKYQPMICTAAAWNVSHNYVPYRPNWDLVCSQLNQAMYNIQYGSASGGKFACSAANTYEYTGLSITVPANRVYEIHAYDRYSQSAPLAIALADTNSNMSITTGSVMIGESSGKTSTDKNYTCRSLTCIAPKVDSNATYYLFVKRDGTGLNPIGLMWRQIV